MDGNGHDDDGNSGDDEMYFIIENIDSSLCDQDICLGARSSCRMWKPFGAFGSSRNLSHPVAQKHNWTKKYTMFFAFT